MASSVSHVSGSRFVQEHGTAIDAEGANDSPKVISLDIDTQKPPMLAIDQLPINEIRLRIIASRHLRQ
jgi:hypothetical protein